MSPGPDFLSSYGPWAIVAGASEGLGAAFATQLAAAGLNLALVARRPRELAKIADGLTEKYRVEHRCIEQDLASSDAIALLEERTRDLDVGLVVYNAALSLIGPFLDESLDRHLEELAVNCRAPLSIVHTFGKRLRERGRGGIVLMSSLSGFQGSPLISNYAATKAYNTVLGEGLWDEYRDYGVDVLVCCAGATLTPNYETSKPASTSALAPKPMPPNRVVTDALAALGKKPTLVPGGGNRFAAFLMNRIFPRKTAVTTMGKNMRSMYPDGKARTDPGVDGAK